jgi:16S rRNA processing protein RimM
VENVAAYSERGISRNTSTAVSGWVVVGQIRGLYGVQGWVKVFSHTRSREGILGYAPLYLRIQGEWQAIVVEEGRLQGKGVVLKLRGYNHRDAAARLLGCDIAIRREQLSPLPPGEYYWAELEGLRVVTVDGIELGKIERLFETGANDVIVVAGERERLIPFLQGDVIKRIDLEQGVMQVDWDPTF